MGLEPSPLRPSHAFDSALFLFLSLSNTQDVSLPSFTEPLLVVSSEHSLPIHPVLIAILQADSAAEIHILD